VVGRRFLPLILLVGLGLLGLLARLYQVQVVEHEVWAAEAANLMREARTIPYLRGRITDRDGRPFVQDEVAHAVRFVYREFRRRHPLGQVAHARAALEDRSVPLPEALANLEAWGTALVESPAAELASFEASGAARLGDLEFAAVEPGTARRRSRARTVRFYLHGLLEASPADWRAIQKRLKAGEGLERTWTELVAEAEGVAPAEVRERLRRRLARVEVRLGQLAVQMDVVGPEGELPVTREEALDLLVDALEEERRGIEDAIARDLFLEATGFEPGRVEPELLLRLVDLGFLAGRLGWSPERTREWARASREAWLETRRDFHVPRAAIRARLRADRGEDAVDAFLGELARLFDRRPRTPREARARRSEWWAIEGTAVFDELPDLFERVELEGEAGPVMPHQEAAARELRGGGWDAERLARLVPLEQAEAVAARFPPQPWEDWRGRPQEPWRPPTTASDAGLRLLRRLAPPHDPDAAAAGDPARPRDEEELLRWVADLWEARFQDELGRVAGRLEEAVRAAGEALPLELAEERLERAAGKLDYFVRDRGSRPRDLDDRPDDALVLALTRYEAEYAGFEVEPRTRRLALALDEDDRLVARELIGVVRESTLEEVLEQQYQRRDLGALLRKRQRTAADREAIERIATRLYRADEVHGTSGVEGLMDEVLRGRNGFEVQEGLQQRETGTRSALFQDKVDGRDVELTLSIELQQAAQRTIEAPYLPNSEDRRDEHWFRNPVGAIVLATVEGELLAAASAPKEPHEASGVRDGERGFAYDRTLRMPLFQPPGSIFKPFVAAYALSRLELDPEQPLPCEVRPEGSAGWNRVACHRRWGHGAIGLDEAIHVSCNAYFAQVGERLGGLEGLRELAHLFGFDRPTGVLDPGRGGLVEDHAIARLRREAELSLTELDRAGNGLEVVQATPVQVARALAGLATGRLPRMRLVRTVDGAPVPPVSEPIPLSGWALERVRDAMRGVITVGSGAGKGLGEEQLGFALAGKTGSADYLPMTPAYAAQLRGHGQSPPDMRKHTWFAGFFPHEAPRFVVVVYCHDIGVTASHSAVHVASQFLRTPEVQAHVREALR
jgi:cell division protein FtsI/penicillin-binding protein 2